MKKNRLAVILIGLVVLVSCGKTNAQTDPEGCRKVYGHPYDATLKCYESADLLVGCYEDNEGAQDQATGCYVNEDVTVVVVSDTTSAPFLHLLDDGFAYCGEVLKTVVPACDPPAGDEDMGAD